MSIYVTEDNFKGAMDALITGINARPKHAELDAVREAVGTKLSPPEGLAGVVGYNASEGRWEAVQSTSGPVVSGPPVQGGTTGATGAPVNTIEQATSEYNAAISASSPSIRIAMQDNYDTKLATSVGISVPVTGTAYVNDNWSKLPPAGLGRQVYFELRQGVTDSYIDLAPLAGNLSTLLRTNSWSFTGWFRPDNSGWNQTLFSMFNASNANLSLQVGSENANGRAKFNVNGSAIEGDLPSSFYDGNWHMFGVAVNGGNAIVVFDGVQVASGPVNNVTTDVTRAYGLSYQGDANVGSSMVGSVTQWCFHSTPLTATSITNLFTTGRDAKPYVYPLYGSDPYFGGSAAFFGKIPNASSIANDSFAHVYNWWGELRDDGTYWSEEAAAHSGGAHSNRGSNMWAANGQVSIPDYKHLFGDDNASNVPLWTVGDEWDMGDPVLPGFTNRLDEMNSEIATIPADRYAYINFGTGSTLGHRNRQFMRQMMGNDKIVMTSADLYWGSINNRVLDMAKPVYGVQNIRDARKPIMYAYTVRRVLNTIEEQKVVLNAIGLGHPNTDTDYANYGYMSVPSADEVEASAMAGYLGGASGILWFPEGYKSAADDQCPVWNSTTAYKYGDQVKSPTNANQFYWAAKDIPAGVDPRNDTTGSNWRAWQATGNMLATSTTEFAQGVPDAVKRAYSVAKAKAAVICAPRIRVRAHDDLWAVVWENVNGKSYMLVMQNYWKDSGTYSIKVPTSASGKTLNVDHKLRANDAGIRTVTSGAFNETFNSPSDFFWYSWDYSETPATSTTPTASNISTIGHIGDSLTQEPGQAMIAGKFSSVASLNQTYWYGLYGKHINQPDSAGKTTVQNIQEMRAAGTPDPDIWSIALATNLDNSVDPNNNLNMAPIEAEIRAVLAEIDRFGVKPVMWTGIATEWSYPHATHEAVNATIKRIMEERGVNGWYVDWWTYVKTNCIDLGLNTQWFYDKVHMTSLGYDTKYNYLAGQAVEFKKKLSANSTTVTTSVGTSLTIAELTL